MGKSDLQLWIGRNADLNTEKVWHSFDAETEKNWKMLYNVNITEKAETQRKLNSQLDERQTWPLVSLS
jgi:hypothetical protein